MSEVATTIKHPPTVSTSGQPIPSDSSHKLGSKRQRTVQAQNLTSSLTKNSTAQTSQVHVGTTLTFSNFLQNSNELNEKNNLQDQIFSYILQKHILHHQAHLSPPHASLSEFRLFLEENNQCSQQPINGVLHGVIE